jgi:hypothetical protein
MNNFRDYFAAFTYGYQLPPGRQFFRQIQSPSSPCLPSLPEPEKRYYARWVDRPGMLIDPDQLKKHIEDRFYPFRSGAIQRDKGQILHKCNMCPFKLRYTPQTNGQYQEQIDQKNMQHCHNGQRTLAPNMWKLPPNITRALSPSLVSQKKKTSTQQAQTKSHKEKADSGNLKTATFTTTLAPSIVANEGQHSQSSGATSATTSSFKETIDKLTIQMTATQRQLNDVHDSWQKQTVELASNQSEIVQLQNEIERLTTSAQEVQQQSKNEVIVHKTYEQNEINHLKTSLQEVRQELLDKQREIDQLTTRQQSTNKVHSLMDNETNNHEAIQLDYPQTTRGSIPIGHAEYVMLNPEQWLNDNLINFWMKWYVPHLSSTKLYFIFKNSPSPSFTSQKDFERRTQDRQQSSLFHISLLHSTKH